MISNLEMKVESKVEKVAAQLRVCQSDVKSVNRFIEKKN